jgi:hypothetical protein
MAEEQTQIDWSKFLLCAELEVTKAVNMVQSEMTSQVKAFQFNKKKNLMKKKIKVKKKFTQKRINKSESSKNLRLVTRSCIYESVLKKGINDFLLSFYRNSFFVNINNTLQKVKDLSLLKYTKNVNEFQDYFRSLLEFKDVEKACNNINYHHLNSLRRLTESLKLEHESRLLEISEETNNAIKRFVNSNMVNIKIVDEGNKLIKDILKSIGDHF